MSSQSSFNSIEEQRQRLEIEHNRRQLELNKRHLEINRQHELLELRLRRKRKAEALRRRSPPVRSPSAQWSPPARSPLAQWSPPARSPARSPTPVRWKPMSLTRKTTEFQNMYESSNLRRTHQVVNRKALAFLIDLKTNNPTAKIADLIHYAASVADDPTLPFDKETREYLRNNTSTLLVRYTTRKGKFDKNKRLGDYVKAHILKHQKKQQKAAVPTSSGNNRRAAAHILTSFT